MITPQTGAWETGGMALFHTDVGITGRTNFFCFFVLLFGGLWYKSYILGILTLICSHQNRSVDFGYIDPELKIENWAEMICI